MWPPRIRKDSVLIISHNESAWVIHALQEQSWALWQIWKPALSYVIHKVLTEYHLEWCNAKITSSLSQTRRSEGAEESECEREEKETEEDSKGLIISIMHLFAKENRIPFQAVKKVKIVRTTLQRWLVIHNNRDIIFQRLGGTLLCTSVGLAARFLIFIYILIYFHEKPCLFPSPVQRSAEDESVILYKTTRLCLIKKISLLCRKPVSVVKLLSTCGIWWKIEDSGCCSK